VLFVDDGNGEGLELHVFGEEGVGADEDVGGAIGEGREDAVSVGGGRAAGEEFDASARPFEQARDARVVLLGEDLGRGHEAGLLGARDSEEHGVERDEGLAAADVALDEAVGGRGGSEVALKSSTTPPGLGECRGSGQDAGVNFGVTFRAGWCGARVGGSSGRRVGAGAVRHTRGEAGLQDLVLAARVGGACCMR
jgi:hypothetical protein